MVMAAVDSKLMAASRITARTTTMTTTTTAMIRAVWLLVAGG